MGKTWISTMLNTVLSLFAERLKRASSPVSLVAPKLLILI